MLKRIQTDPFRHSINTARGERQTCVSEAPREYPDSTCVRKHASGTPQRDGGDSRRGRCWPCSHSQETRPCLFHTHAHTPGTRSSLEAGRSKAATGHQLTPSSSATPAHPAPLTSGRGPLSLEVTSLFLPQTEVIRRARPQTLGAHLRPAPSPPHTDHPLPAPPLGPCPGPAVVFRPPSLLPHIFPPQAHKPSLGFPPPNTKTLQLTVRLLQPHPG